MTDLKHMQVSICDVVVFAYVSLVTQLSNIRKLRLVLFLFNLITILMKYFQVFKRTYYCILADEATVVTVLTFCLQVAINTKRTPKHLG